MEKFGDYKVPVRPKRDWRWMLDTSSPCRHKHCRIGNDYSGCFTCIYSCVNAYSRERFYRCKFPPKKYKVSDPSGKALEAHRNQRRDSRGRFICKITDKTPDLPFINKSEADMYTFVIKMPKVNITVEGVLDV